MKHHKQKVFHFISIIGILANIVQSEVTIDVPIDGVTDDLIRQTKNGPVRGEKRVSSLYPDESFLAFHAIPYAEPPIGSKRFKHPISHSNWSEVYDASNADHKNKCCPQPSNEGIIQNETSENCLYLSTYTPVMRKSEEPLLPVLVWIHGGSFVYGCGMFPISGPEIFMKGSDVVIVSINYRLGLLGFLSLASDKLTGNMGLLDQVMALQWVQDNIAEFGGDPNKVTIWGESAGSWAVTYHMISPLSKGLFHQVIGQSGTILSPAWREYTEEQAKRWGDKVSDSVGCGSLDNDEETVLCLQGVPVDNFTDSWIQNGPNSAQAVIDGGFSSNPFLPNLPQEIIKGGDYNYNVSILLGCNRDEGILTTGYLIANTTMLKVWKELWREHGLGAFTLFQTEFGYQTDKILQAVDNITNFYIGSLENMDIQHISKITEMVTDSMFCYSEHALVSQHLAKAPPNSIFQYMYAHEGAHSYSEAMEQGGPYGVAHGDETYLQFHPYGSNLWPDEKLFTNADQAVSDTLVGLWKNFVKTSNPSSKDIIWSPVSDKLNRDYLFLTYGPSSRMEYPNNWNRRMKIWDETIQTLLENTDEEMKSEIDPDAKNELKTATPDPILDIY